jgi:hypothetical protein
MGGRGQRGVRAVRTKRMSQRDLHARRFGFTPKHGAAARHCYRAPGCSRASTRSRLSLGSPRGGGAKGGPLTCRLGTLCNLTMRLIPWQD